MNFLEFWMIFILISVVAILIEIFVPTMFCINFAIAGIITAIISFFIDSFIALVFIFIVLSVLSILFVKPLLTKWFNKEDSVDFAAQYIGKVVKTIEPVTMMNGAVTIYDERWKARLQNEGEEIPADADVKIVGHDSTILFVERI